MCQRTLTGNADREHKVQQPVALAIATISARFTSTGALRAAYLQQQAHLIAGLGKAGIPVV